MCIMCFAVDTPTRTPPEREIVCVSLKKDPKLGFGEFNEVPLQSRMCFIFLFLQLNVGALLCRMTYVQQSLTLEGCFYIHC